MARRKLEANELGEISIKEVARKNIDGRVRTIYRARVRVGCIDGTIRQVQADAPGKANAREKVKAAARLKAYGVKAEQTHFLDITKDSTVLELVEFSLDNREIIRDFSKDVRQQKGQVKEQTVKKYRETLSTIRGEHGDMNLGAIPLGNVTGLLVTGWLESVSKRVPTTARLCKIVLSMAFNIAMRKGIVDWKENPTAGTEMNKGVHREPKALTPTEEAKAIELVRRWQTPRKFTDLRGIVELLSGTGLRPSEALALRWEDIDLSATPAQLTVNGTVVELEGGKKKGKGIIRQDVTKTMHGWRTIFLSEATTNMLMERWINREHDYVFPNREGGLLNPHNVNRAWREARGEELPEVKLKDFRPTVATKIERKHGAKAAQRHLGHGSTTITENYYIEAAPAGDYTDAL